jgi:hypothetical protein
MTMMIMMIIMYRRRGKKPTTPPEQIFLSEIWHGRNAHDRSAAKARRNKRRPGEASFTNSPLFLSFAK